MANICENTMHICTESKKNIAYIGRFLTKNFPGAVIEDQESYLEIHFDSKWTFPEDEMDELYKEMPDKDDISITCLSIEWGDFYAQFNFMDKDGWHC